MNAKGNLFRICLLAVLTPCSLGTAVAATVSATAPVSATVVDPPPTKYMNVYYDCTGNNPKQPGLFGPFYACEDNEQAYGWYVNQMHCEVDTLDGHDGEDPEPCPE